MEIGQSKAVMARAVLAFALMAGIVPASGWAKTVKVQMTAVESEVVIDGEGTKYKAWTFNNQFPGHSCAGRG